MQTPFFSIIVPTHGRDAALDRCLEALGGLDYPPERYEVVVVYDGSSAAQPPEMGGRAVKLLTQPRSGPAAARNMGASRARGEVLAFTDDDCIPAADWLLRLSAAFDQYPGSMIGGRIVNALPDNIYASASQLLVDFLYEHYNHNPDQAQFITSNNMALPREQFLEMAGFDSRFSLAAGEDREFSRRWLDRGNSIVYDPAVLVRHAHSLTLIRFWQQHVNYGRGAFRYHHNRARQQHERLKLEGASFYVNLMVYPFKRSKPLRQIRLFALFWLMQAATMVGFFQEPRSTRSR